VSADRPAGPPRRVTPNKPPDHLLLAVDDDLMAAALAAVDRRSARPTGGTAAFDEDDLMVDEGDEGDDGVVIGDDNEDDDDDDDDDSAPRPGRGGGGSSREMLTALESLMTEVRALQGQVEERDQRIRALEAELTDVNGDRKKATALLLRANERIQRAEQTARTAQEGRSRLEEAHAASESALAQAKGVAERAAADARRMNDRKKAEVDEVRRFAAVPIINELLPVYDNLRMALTHGEGDVNALHSGVKMIADQFARTFERIGLVPVVARPTTPFDPAVHEALQRVPTDQMAPGLVFEELSPGFLLNGRLLRAARVSVSATLV
jgi:molecular chaperone GrpE